MNRIEQRGLKSAILTMSFVQMTTNAVAAILADIAMQFPQASVTKIQYLMTFPNLMVVGVSIIAARLAQQFSKRSLAATGLSFVSIAGIGSFFVHSTLFMLYLWAGILGIGVGLVVPMANSLIADYFQGNERDGLLGYQTGAANAGSMLMTYFGGILAVAGWYFDYIVYLFAIPGLILTLKYVPKQNVSNQKKADRHQYVLPEKREWEICVLAAVYMIVFYLGPTNIALYLDEKKIGNTVAAGNASTLLLFGGGCMGFFYGKIVKYIGKQTISLGFLVLFAGYILIYNSSGLLTIDLGCFLIGMSNPLVLPQCMGSVVGEDKQRSTVMMSVVFAAANLGTFFAPTVTTIARVVMGTDTAAGRFLFAGIVSGCLAIIMSGILYMKRRKK